MQNIWHELGTLREWDMIKVLSDHEVARMVERIAFRQIHLVLDGLRDKVRLALVGREEQDEGAKRILGCIEEMERAARCFEVNFEVKKPK